jgi:nicotinamide mononucleotide transporter
MSMLEIVAVVIGVINILLIIRRSVWNFPFGIVMVALYFVIFREAKLYSDAGLQVFFAGIQFYGWWAWSANKLSAGEIIVQRLGALSVAYWVAVSLAATAGWGYFMMLHTDASHPYWDAAVAMLSVVAQLLMTWRFLQNWWWWIVVDVISIPLYIVKGLYLTAGLYGLFLILAIAGLIEWRRVSKYQ